MAKSADFWQQNSVILLNLKDTRFQYVQVPEVHHHLSHCHKQWLTVCCILPFSHPQNITDYKNTDKWQNMAGVWFSVLILLNGHESLHLIGHFQIILQEVLLLEHCVTHQWSLSYTQTHSLALMQGYVWKYLSTMARQGGFSFIELLLSKLRILK